MAAARPSNNADVVRAQRAARTVEREVAPLWHDRFARLVLSDLPEDEECFALDVHSGTGRTTDELLRRLGEGARVLGLQSDNARMSVAKIRLGNTFAGRAYLKAGSFDDITGMSDATYDLTVANLVLGLEVPDWRAGLEELVRITKPDGIVAASMPLRNTWCEVEDLFAEVLRDRGLTDALGRLERRRKLRPTPAQVAAVARQIGLERRDFVVEHQRFQLLFGSGRELLFSPLVEQTQVPIWRAVIGSDADPTEVLWQLKTSLDTYFARQVLGVTIVAGCLRVQVPGGARAGTMAKRYWSQFPELDALWGGLAGGDAASTGDDVGPADSDAFELDISVDDEEEVDDADLDDFLEIGLDRDLDPASAPDPELLDDPEPTSVAPASETEIEAALHDVLVETTHTTPALPIEPSQSFTAGVPPDDDDDELLPMDELEELEEIDELEDFGEVAQLPPPPGVTARPAPPPPPPTGKAPLRLQRIGPPKKKQG